MMTVGGAWQATGRGGATQQCPTCCCCGCCGREGGEEEEEEGVVGSERVVSREVEGLASADCEISMGSCLLNASLPDHAFVLPARIVFVYEVLFVGRGGIEVVLKSYKTPEGTV